MKHFPSIEKLDTAILYTLELASSLSILLLAFGLIASMANVQTKGSVLSDSLMMQQTLNLTLENAYLHVFIPVELLIWIRSVAIVLLIVAHAIRHVPTQDEQPVRPEHRQVTMSPELIEAIRLVIVQEIQTEEIEQKTLPEPEVADNCERVKAYIAQHPNAKVREVAQALSMSTSGSLARSCGIPQRLQVPLRRHCDLLGMTTDPLDIFAPIRLL